MSIQDKFFAFRKALGGPFTPGNEGSRIFDLEGKTFLVKKELMIRKANSIILKNFRIVADEGFEGDYLINISQCKNIVLEDITFECNKRCSGVMLDRFLRIKLSRITIKHQTLYGIHSVKCGPSHGNNHELEVIDSNIMEYEFGDGYNENTVHLPKFDISENRVSTGIFLGQADNVVADCNIHLCKTGIYSNMRANRIQGNHITAGGTKDRALFDCIEVNKKQRGACIIHNNYIDNGRLKISTSSRAMSDRNYVKVTDNLFYRGYNHPENGDTFNHIVVETFSENSSFANVIIQSNLFYNQDENLDEINPERSIIPFSIRSVSPGCDISPDRCFGSNMKSNTFTYSEGLVVVPMGTELILNRKLSTSDSELVLDLKDNIPFGRIISAKLISFSASNFTSGIGEDVVKISIISISEIKVVLDTPLDCEITVEIIAGSFYPDCQLVAK